MGDPGQRQEEEELGRSNQWLHSARIRAGDLVVLGTGTADEREGQGASSRDQDEICQGWRSVSPGRSSVVVAGTGGDCHQADMERNSGLG